MIRIPVTVLGCALATLLGCGDTAADQPDATSADASAGQGDATSADASETADAGPTPDADPNLVCDTDLMDNVIADREIREGDYCDDIQLRHGIRDLASSLGRRPAAASQF